MVRFLWLTLPAAALVAAAALIWWSNAAQSRKAVAADVLELLHINPSEICHATPPVALSADAGDAGDDELPIEIAISEAFKLVDQHGRWRTPDDLFEGKMSLLFFGYASCEGVCTIAIPAIAEAVALLNKDQNIAQPILVTIDPGRDTPAYMRKQLAQFSPDFVGLTGPKRSLGTARKMFNVQADPVFEDDNGTVFKHGSFIYLIDAAGKVVSFLPPVLPPAQIARIARKYI